MTRTRPLEVYEVIGRDLEVSGREVVLDGRVDLHDVAALAAHVDVHYPTQTKAQKYGISARQNVQMYRTVHTCTCSIRITLSNTTTCDETYALEEY